MMVVGPTQTLRLEVFEKTESKIPKLKSYWSHHYAPKRNLGSLDSAPQVTRIAVLLGCSLGTSLSELCWLYYEMHSSLRETQEMQDKQA